LKIRIFLQNTKIVGSKDFPTTADFFQAPVLKNQSWGTLREKYNNNQTNNKQIPYSYSGFSTRPFAGKQVSVCLFLP
jgi:hypothetical protein